MSYSFTSAERPVLVTGEPQMDGEEKSRVTGRTKDFYTHNLNNVEPVECIVTESVAWGNITDELDSPVT